MGRPMSPGDPGSADSNPGPEPRDYAVPQVRYGQEVACHELQQGGLVFLRDITDRARQNLPGYRTITKHHGQAI
jgi:hypothetical protein